MIGSKVDRNQPTREANMEKLIQLLEQIAVSDGLHDTHLSGVRVFKGSMHMQRTPLVYNSGIIIVAQGSKNIYIADQTFTYNKDNYLVLTVPLPIECEGFLLDGKPLLGLVIDIDLTQLNSIITNLEGGNVGSDISSSAMPGLFTQRADHNFNDIIFRIARTMTEKVGSKILGEGLLKELLYNIISSKNGAGLYALAIANTKSSKIETALLQIHQNFQKQIDVEQLAFAVNMSISSFHRAFKDITLCSPMQYLKKIRLGKARVLLIDENIKVSEVARMVGYESISQFSREFKRHFGATPSTIMPNL